MKISIIAINDNNNYGNRLQNYVLYKFLIDKLKIEEVNTIWYDSQYMYISRINIFSWKTWIKYIINWRNQRNY